MSIEKVVGLYAHRDRESGQILKYTAAKGEYDRKSGVHVLDKITEFDADMLRAFNTENKRARIVGVASQAQLFIRTIRLPPIADDKLKQIIIYEAQQNIPFPIEEVHWGHRLLRGKDENQVVLYAVKDDIVRESFPETKLDMLVPAFDGIVKLYAGRLKADRKDVAILLSGELCTSFIVPKDSLAMHVRTIPIPLTGEIEDEINNKAARLRAELARSRNFLKTQLSADFSSYLVTDKGSLDKLSDRDLTSGKVSQTINGIPAEYLPPFEVIAANKDIKSDEGALLATAGLVSWPNGCNLRYNTGKESESLVKFACRGLGEQIESLGRFIRRLGDD
jgi:hypothetical protein